MPAFAELSDAAAVIYNIFSPRKIDYGIFGGFAVNALGGNRTSKDLNCAVRCSKQQLVALLLQFPQLQNIGNVREDVAIFMLGEVLIEFFPGKLCVYHHKH